MREAGDMEDGRAMGFRHMRMDLTTLEIGMRDKCRDLELIGNQVAINMRVRGKKGTRQDLGLQHIPTVHS